MNTLFHNVALAAPLFALVFIGFVVMRLSGWSDEVAESLSKFVFVVALPAMMFRLMCGLSSLPPVDARLLIAFFGSCLLVFIIGRLVGWKIFGFDGVSQSVFALGGVFSNNLMLGLPLAKIVLGDAAVPSVAMVLVFNSLILWTLVTVSVEWARHGNLSLNGFSRTLKSVLTNPLILAIIFGTMIGLSGMQLPPVVDTPLSMVAQTATPMSLIALGMGLVQYGIRGGWKISLSITFLKLIVQPVIVWLLARMLDLPLMETRVVVLLGSIALGVNVYLVSKQFKTLEGPVASSLVLSTVLASLTTPLVLTLTG